MKVAEHQFEWMTTKGGLEPYHKFLDIGCSSLMAGILFIDYLDIGNYYGIDIKPEHIENGRKRVRYNNLQYKEPKLIHDGNFNFEYFGEKFDRILAQSVFTHLKIPEIFECLKHVRNVLDKNGIFYATYIGIDVWRSKSSGYNTFFYDFGEFANWGKEAGLKVENIGDWGHPNKGQQLMRFWI